MEEGRWGWRCALCQSHSALSPSALLCHPPFNSVLVADAIESTTARKHFFNIVLVFPGLALVLSFSLQYSLPRVSVQSVQSRGNRHLSRGASWVGGAGVSRGASWVGGAGVTVRLVGCGQAGKQTNKVKQTNGAIFSAQGRASGLVRETPPEPSTPLRARPNTHRANSAARGRSAGTLREALCSAGATLTDPGCIVARLVMPQGACLVPHWSRTCFVRL